MAVYCEVSFPLPPVQTFLYRVPEDLSSRVKTGSRVIAPFGQRKLIGYILEVKNLTQEPSFKVKEIIQVIDDSPVFSESFLWFILQLSRRTLTSPGLLLDMAKPPEARERISAQISLTEKGKAELGKEKFKEPERTILSLLVNRKLSPLYLRRKSGIKRINQILKSLEQEGLIEIKEKLLIKKKRLPEAQSFFRQLILPVKPPGLSEAEYQLIKNLDLSQGGEFLLTGDFERRLKFVLSLAEHCQENYGYILVLVPEILRLKKWEPFIKSTKLKWVIWHSQLSARMREENWTKLRNGQARIVFGTRSALFLPLQPLSLIVVDEEQDEFYYQTEIAAFDAREGAEIRAAVEGSLLIFSSACPRVSQYHRLQQAGSLIGLAPAEPRYARQFRYGEIGQAIKKDLKPEIKAQLEKSGKILFFVNRKGYASYLICPECGYVPSCEKCRIALTLKRKEEKLVCNYCGQAMAAPKICPVCGRKMKIGQARGSEYLKEKIMETFPGVAVEILEDEALNQRGLRSIASGKARIIIGTEYALERLPQASFSLIILVNPENRLNYPDFKAAENCFVTINRVMELIRNDSNSKVIALTGGTEPAVVLNALNRDYWSFYSQEIEHRRLLNYPPFSYLVEVSLSSSSMRSAGRASRQLLEQLSLKFPELELIGPKITRKAWHKEKKEIRFYLRIPSPEQLEAWRTFLRDFKSAHSSLRLTLKVWK